MQWKYYTSITNFAGNHCCEVITKQLHKIQMVVSVNHEGSPIAKYQNIPVRMYIEALNRNYAEYIRKEFLRLWKDSKLFDLDHIGITLLPSLTKTALAFKCHSKNQ